MSLLRNPYHGTEEFGGRPEWAHTWFHGTRGEPEFGVRRKFSDEAQRAALPPEQREMNSGWSQPNQHLGVHFTPLHEVAHKFVGSVSSTPGSLVHAQLGFSNPAVFDSEEHLNIAMAHWASQHYPHWHDEKLNGRMAWNYGDNEGTHRDFSQLPDNHRDRYRLHQKAQDLLTWHPHMPEILRGFTQDLRDRGHHGLIYGNGLEGPYETDAGRGGEAAMKYIKKREDWPRGHPYSFSAIAHPDDIHITHVEHIAPWREEPQGDQRTWEDASDNDEPDEMRDKILDWHRQHGGKLPFRLASAYRPSSGIFAPTTGLDPRLFEDGALRPQVTEAIMERLDRCIRVDVQLAGSDWQEWMRVYLAGGSASEWAGDRPNEQAQDLDVLVGIDLKKAQGYNSFEGMDEQQAATALNAAFRAAFNETGAVLPGVEGTWDLTAYCNPGAYDIRDIKPYAAWDLSDSSWAVKPPHLPEHSLADFDPAVLAHARAVLAEARAILRMPEPLRSREAKDLWEHIHAHRCTAFSPEGHGWQDIGNVDEKWLAYAPGNVLGKIRELALPKTAAADPADFYHARTAVKSGDFLATKPSELPWGDEEWAAARREPWHAASQLAQEQVRWDHPRLLMPFPHGEEGDRMVGHILGYVGYGGDASGAFVARHPHPERGTSNPSWLGRRPGVALHPDKWDYGTVIHEAAHHAVMHAHAVGPNEPQPDEQVHGPEWAGHYARGLNRMSPGAGDDFLGHHQRYRDMIAEGLQWKRPKDLDAADARRRLTVREGAHHGPWYHGTDADLEDGDEVDPRREVSPDPEEGPFAYLSPDAGKAAGFGRNLYEVELSGTAEPVPFGATGEWRSAHPLRVKRKVISGLNGPLPADMTFTHIPSEGHFDPHFIIAQHPAAPAGEHAPHEAGHLRWWGDTGTISTIGVHPDFQRRGLATEMFRRAREITPNLHHSDALSGAGRAWKESLASTPGEKPVKTKDQVNYRPAGGHDRCGNCVMIRLLPPDFESYHCTLVKGLIEEDHVCDEWSPDTEHPTKEAVSLERAADAPTIVASGTRSWDDNTAGGVYLRFGHWPKNERSTNYVTGHPEHGVSAYDLDEHGDPRDPDPGWDRIHEHDEHCEPDCDLDTWNDEYGNDTGEEMTGRILRAEKNRRTGQETPGETAHLVRGEMVGLGHDAEPLLRNVRRVGDWIDHRHLFIPGAERHRLARDEHDEDYEPPEESPSIHREAAAEEDEPYYYHVSPHRLPMGTILRPPGRGQGNWDEDQSGEHVYVTPHQDRAEQYHYLLWEQGHKDPHIYYAHPHGKLEQDPNDAEGLRTKDPVEITGHLFGHNEEGNDESEPRWFSGHHTAATGYDGLTSHSGMIYLEIPEGLVHQVQDGVDDHHVTICYLGKDVDDGSFAEACRRAEQVANGTPPLECLLHGIDTFPASDSSDGKIPAFVPAYIPGIGKVRQQLEDLSASEHRQYKPHVTLGYYADGEELPPPHPPVKLTIGKISVKRGDDVVSYPFRGR